MWKHKKCDGDIYPITNESEWCSKCNQSELYSGDVYLDHYIINYDGNSLANQEAF